MSHSDFPKASTQAVSLPLTATWNLDPGMDTEPEDPFACALDLPRLNTIIANLQQAIGVTITLIDLQGKVLASSLWQVNCPNFHRQQAGTLPDYLQNETALDDRLLQQQQAIYRSPNGLTEGAAPIRINDHHLATVFVGPFFQEEPDPADFRLQANENALDPTDEPDALANIPVIPAQKVKPMLDLVSGLVEQIAELSYDNSQRQQRLEQLDLEFKRRTLELQMQNQILSLISQSAPLPFILEQMVRQIEQQYPGLICSVLLLDEKSGSLRHGAAPSLPEAYNQAVDGLKLGPMAGSCGAAAHSGAILIAEDLYTHPNWQAFRDLVDLAGVRSCWSVPIKDSSNKVLGTFGIYQRQPAKPDQSFSQNMQAFSNLAELAISRFNSAEQIRRMAFYDELTGLANRRLLDERLQQALAASRRSNRFGALLFLDLDNFKQVNDIYGHKTGDALLTAFASRLQQLVRQTDTVARLGGDEFVLLLVDLESDQQAAKQQVQQLLEKICRELSQPFVLDTPDQPIFHCQSSIGLLLYHGATDDADDLLKRADQAMYQAKQLTGTQVCWSDEINSTAPEHSAMPFTV
jgi:diguanylate cyclase (GGDEF)-like protein